MMLTKKSFSFNHKNDLTKVLIYYVRQQCMFGLEYLVFWNPISYDFLLGRYIIVPDYVNIFCPSSFQ